jgi:glycosyltransferase involved in cell wall biosynthesis
MMFRVCVRSYTYNHSLFIEDALNGFVSQKTDFPFVVTIIDDASTDDTCRIITSFVDRCFNTNDETVASREEKEYGTVLFAQHRENLNCFFSVILLKENHYRQKKSKLPYVSRWIDEVPYIALCEGDDYWTDPLKLQKQVDYLDAHPDCMLCVHAADWKTGERIYPRGCQETVPKEYSIDELILCGGLYFATASFVCRTELSKDWPEWRSKAGVGDFPLQILAGIRGGVHYLPDKMCVYRYRSEGSWTSNLRNNEVHIAFHKNKVAWMKLLDEATGHRYQRAIYDQLFSHINALFNLREISYREYSQAFRKSSQKHDGRLMKAFLRYYLEPVYSFLQRIKKSFLPKSHR